jgi:hypothetical protein
VLVGALGERREPGEVLVSPEWCGMSSRDRSQPKDGVGRFTDTAVGFDQLHRSCEPLARNSREARRDLRILERLVVDGVSRVPSPPLDPEPAESAVAIEDDERARHPSFIPRGSRLMKEG